jgi:predicted dehydrogenase
MNVMKTVGVGVVGAGYMGLNHIKTYRNIKNIDTIGYYDPWRDVNIPGVFKFHTIEELASVCDCVSICSPTPLHYEHAIQVIDNYCHVLIEKPATENVKQQEIIKTTAASHGRIVQVGFIEQYNPVIKYINKHLRNPDFISCIRTAPFSYRGADVSVFKDLSVHDIGIIISCFDSNLSATEHCSGESLLINSVEDDYITCHLRFNDNKGVILTHRVGASKNREVVLRKGGEVYCFDLIHKQGALVLESGNQDLKLNTCDPLKDQLTDFIHCVINGNSPEYDINFSIRVGHIQDEFNKKMKKR